MRQKLSIKQLIRQAQAAVCDVHDRSQIGRVWDLLQQHDRDGNSRGPLPYTDAALVELTVAHERDPQNVGIMHHLAVAHHARAWDMELGHDHSAAAHWEHALAFWSRVSSASEFWGTLRLKLSGCDSTASPDFLVEVRSNLLESLLDIHVDFVKLYCESCAVDRAAVHMGIVARSRLPPTVKKRLVEKVFVILAQAIPQAKATRALGPALDILDRFLTLFPSYLPALRAYVEICAEWLGSLSYQDHWKEIECLGCRAEMTARLLGRHPELAHDPLAKAGLEQLIRLLIGRAHDRAATIFAAHHGELSEKERETARSTFAFAIRWGRLANACACEAHAINFPFADCLLNDAALNWEEGIAVMGSESLDKVTRLNTVIGLLDKALVILEEAEHHAPPESENLRLQIKNQLEETRKAIEELSNQRILATFVAAGGGKS